MKKIILFILFLGLFGIGRLTLDSSVYLDTDIQIQEWDGLYRVYDYLGWKDSIKLRVYTKITWYEWDSIKPGSYSFDSDSKSIQSFIETLETWPELDYTSITIIEWYSKYDIDQLLYQNGIFSENEYIDYVSSRENIKKYSEKYKFFQSDYKSLEGFLYPDTYHLSSKEDSLSKLVSSQLDRFDDRIYQYWKNNKDYFLSKIDILDFYDTLILASIVEKEEFYMANKPVVAGVLINRIQNNMRLDADITLCYGLEKPYSFCDNTTIVQNLDDTNNLYNTRALTWLTPSPIANPSLDTFRAVLGYKESDYFYYLHDRSGNIHSSKNLQEHNLQKSKYLGS